jgi:hypothetical protein
MYEYKLGTRTNRGRKLKEKGILKKKQNEVEENRSSDSKEDEK